MQIIIIVLVAAVVLYVLFKAAKMLLRIVLLLIILGVAYLTNPELGAHRKAVEKKADEHDINVNDHEITRTDYKVFSLTKSNDGGRESLIGVGAFTRVWIFKLDSNYLFL
jgi:hypothetical protein